jgi:uncharacterized membrane protein
MLPWQELFKSWTIILASLVEASAGLVIALAAIQATFRALKLFFNRNIPDREDTKTHVRLSLGRWLALALEFELAADILRTAVAPTWTEIGQLAAIVILRTALNYFLQREIDQAAEKNDHA